MVFYDFTRPIVYCKLKIYGWMILNGLCLCTNLTKVEYFAGATNLSTTLLAGRALALVFRRTALGQHLVWFFVSYV